MDEEGQERVSFGKKVSKVKVAKKIRFKVCRKLAQLFCSLGTFKIDEKKNIEKLSTMVEESLLQRSSSLVEY